MQRYIVGITNQDECASEGRDQRSWNGISVWEYGENGHLGWKTKDTKRKRTCREIGKGETTDKERASEYNEGVWR